MLKVTKTSNPERILAKGARLLRSRDLLRWYDTETMYSSEQQPRQLSRRRFLELMALSIAGCTQLSCSADVLVQLTQYIDDFFQIRTPRSAETRDLYPGVRYLREIDVLHTPTVVHTIFIDIQIAQPEFFTTPADTSSGYEVHAATVSEFLQEHHGTEFALAINTHFFSPFFAHLLNWYYPHSGEGVDLHGLAISDSTIVSESDGISPSLCFSPHIIEFLAATCPPDTEQALAGNHWLIQKQKIVATQGGERHPRTAIGLIGTHQQPKQLILQVIDGRQNRFSHGATHKESAELLHRHGVTTAINLDGGGSSTLVIYQDKKIEVLNNPIHVGIWKNERPVGGHLIIRFGAA